MYSTLRSYLNIFVSVLSFGLVGWFLGFEEIFFSSGLTSQLFGTIINLATVYEITTMCHPLT